MPGNLARETKLARLVVKLCEPLTAREELLLSRIAELERDNKALLAQVVRSGRRGLRGRGQRRPDVAV